MVCGSIASSSECSQQTLYTLHHKWRSLRKKFKLIYRKYLYDSLWNMIVTILQEIRMKRMKIVGSYVA